VYKNIVLSSLLISGLFFSTDSFAQSGCTDANALNYEPTAINNDGSCLYPITSFNAPLKAILADTLKEVSGLIQTAGNRWWSFNDGGNDDTFFEMNPETGTILKYIKLKQASNEDWEEITSDGNNLYIGDFGNNNGGNRQNLAIYKIPVSAIGNSSLQSINETEYTYLPFKYEDQTNFDPVDEDNVVFDCEAMIFFNGKIHLFSKNWQNKTTTHYVLNEATGTAEKRETFDVQGLITGAAITPDGKTIALLGYNKSGIPNVFFWLLWDIQGDDFFGGNKRRFELGSPLVYGKSEAIAFKNNNEGYIGNEFLEIGGIVIVPQATRTFDFSDYIVANKDIDTNPQNGFTVYPNPLTESADIQWFGTDKLVHFQVKNAIGQVIFQTKEKLETLNTNQWNAGFYTFEAIYAQQVISLKLIRLGTSN
jgi:hypothetical protein